MLRFPKAKALRSIIGLVAALLTSEARADYRQLHGCLTGPAAAYADPSCSAVDFDHDGDVDLQDFSRFQASCPEIVGNECADDLDCDDKDDMTLDECVIRCGSETVCENTEVPGYRQYFTDNPTVKAASIDQFDFPTLNKFWGFVRELERVGSFRLDPPQGLQDCGPGDPCTQIFLWGDESVTYP